MQVIEKPWGKEETLRTERDYVIKKLFINVGKKSSLQYHKHKTKTIYLLSGMLSVFINNKTFIMKNGNHRTILPGEVHRIECISTPDSLPYQAIYLECSTTELDDVVLVKGNDGGK